MIGLETAYAVTNTAVENLTPLRTVELFSINPRKIFGLEMPNIDINQKICFTLFDPTIEWTPQKQDLKSRSANSPFLDKKLKGKVIGTLHPNAISLFV
jgi:dihydroorotase